MLRFLGGFLQALERQSVFGKVKPLVFFEFGDNPGNYFLVKIVPAQMRVAVHGFHFNRILGHLQNRDVKRAAPEIIDQNLLIFLSVKTIGERGGRGLVQNPLDVEASDFSGVLGGLPLRVVKIGRHGDNRVRNFPAEFRFGAFFQLLQNHRRDFLGPVPFFVHLRLHAARGRFADFVREQGFVFLNFLV